MTKVYVEFQRVQTWLFAVPRLRAMVGANTLLGETLRIDLPRLAREQSSWELAGGLTGFPTMDATDPLSHHDDPAADAMDGIISHDGGHFEACFASGVESFVAQAAALIQCKLPGLRFRISVNQLPLDTAGANLPTELPILAPCEWTGRGLASDVIHQGRESATVSFDVSERHKAAQRAEDGQAADLVSLLAATTKLKDFRRAPMLKAFARGSYLALIHADGNGVGSAAGKTDAERATFFHRNRVLLRRALRVAVDRACQSGEFAPVQPLMLGGDDLLLISRAETALPFVVELCAALDRFQDESQAEFKLTLGVGVVFSHPTIPINRLHDVAERLAASAKRRFRGFTDDVRRSVVDWAVYTTSWVDDPEEIRRRDWVRRGGDTQRVLSRRPVDALGIGLDSLQGLLTAAERIKGAPRSQLRYLVEQLPKGRALSELAFSELSREARKPLENVGIDKIWTASGSGTLLTSLLDLVEISEIGRLGQRATEGADESAVTGDFPEALNVEA